LGGLIIVYEAYYGLHSNPFSLVPDPGFLFLGRKHKVALSLLEYGLLNRAAFTVITGQPGTGKTTLLNAILDRSEREVTLGVLSHTHAGLGSLLPWVLMTFGLDGKGMDSVELYRTFARFLAQEHTRHRRVVLVVDEAQNLGSAMLEELRLLSNLNDGRRQTLQIILSGQPALHLLLRRSELLQLAQRIAVDYHLEPLGEEETPEYICHRIAVVGRSAKLLTDLACHTVHRLTGGNPRLINQICDISLAYGFAEQTPWITAATVIKAATDRRANGILPLTKPDSSTFVSEEEQRAEQAQLASLGKTEAPPKEAKKPQKLQPILESPPAFYQRGVAFKDAGAFKQAIAYFEQAGRDAGLAVKANTQIALCLKESGRTEEAARALQQIWNSRQGTVQERRQIRYLLARTLEAAGLADDARAHYQALREEQSDYRDVTERLSRLSSRRASAFAELSASRASWMKALTRSWTQLIRSSS
jgi:general secretion pathway protein A